MQLTGQRRRPTRIKIDKLRILYNFPGKQYVEKAPTHSLRYPNLHLLKKKVDIYPGHKADIYPGKEP